MTQAVALAQLGGSDTTLPFRNRIINGDMRIDQRNAGASVTPTNGNYTVDRWSAAVSVTSKFSAQQNAGSVTPPDGFTHYLGCTSLSAYTVGAAETLAITQPIEGYNITDLAWGTANAKTVTLSFWVRSSLTGTFGGSLRNSAADRSYPFSYTISSANTWEQKSVTIAGDTTGTWLTTNGIGIQLIISLGSGSTRSGTAGAWAGANYTNATGATSVVGTNAATFYITGVQLETGTVATPFERRPFGMELILCQRYYESSTPHGTLPTNGADSTSLSSNSFCLATFVPWGSTNASRPTIRFAVQKRAQPTIQQYGNNAGLLLYLGSGAGGISSDNTLTSNVNMTLNAVDATMLCLNNQATGETIFGCGGAWTASAEL